MKIKIGDAEQTTRRRPSDLDAQLIAATGCNAAEMARILSASPLAGTVANALLPFLPEEGRPGAAELATAIGKIGVIAVAAEVAKLYSADAEPAGDAKGGDAA